MYTTLIPNKHNTVQRMNIKRGSIGKVLLLKTLIHIAILVGRSKKIQTKFS